MIARTNDDSANRPNNEAAAISEEASPASIHSRELHLLRPLAISLALFVTSCVWDQLIRWTDPIRGLTNGLILGVILSFAWLIYGLIPGLLVYWIYRRKKWFRWQTPAIAFPGVGMVILVFVGLVVAPPTARGRLKQLTGADLPASARDIRTYFTGGGLADYADVYYFQCNAAETFALIEALDLKLDPGADRHTFSSELPHGWSQPLTWKGLTTYTGGREEGGWHYFLCTDETREHICLFICCM